jgi:hypothetical protein
LATIQAYRRVVLLEGPTDRDLLAAYGRAVLGGAVWQQVERRVAFCYCQGNPRRQDVVRFRQLLQQVMAQAGDALRLFVLADRDYHPDPAALREALPNHLLTWHVWERTEIENYLLCPPALARLVSAADEQSSFDALLLQQEFERLVEATRDRANDRLVKAFTEMERGMDPGMASRRAREYLETHWARERLALADAKETVLPGLKRWLQARGLGQFSDRGLAETLTAEDLPPEVHDVARRLAEFAGVRVAGRSF